MAEAAAAAEIVANVNVDQEWTDGTIDEACKWTGDLILKMRDLGDSAKDVCDQGKYNGCFKCPGYLF